MAVLALTSKQLAPGYRGRPTDDHGKLRFQYFETEAVAVAGDINTTVDLAELPPGAVRLLPGKCRIKCTALGASRTLDVGHRAYQSKDYRTGVTADEAENETAFITARDVSGATDAVFSTTVLKYDLYSKAGVVIFAKIEGGTLPVGAVISGYLEYVYD